MRLELNPSGYSNVYLNGSAELLSQAEITVSSGDVTITFDPSLKLSTPPPASSKESPCGCGEYHSSDSDWTEGDEYNSFPSESHLARYKGQKFVAWIRKLFASEPFVKHEFDTFLEARAYALAFRDAYESYMIDRGAYGSVTVCPASDLNHSFYEISI